ncbi:interferon-inducible double-stranded RNA-dependent protein kinase activator A homolog B-like [Anopheles stephensi]|uniref:interferon-inducible double-stranded RNA-dependent protein kinase activator A homolog B-like n=1 Tax=Anopheles stephensi TaxID=30069 RepID=UPI00165883B8|nr:interferon-inducible double-stranded RNA-dependent protein kinase activator A homolog B-like [Anopheles stephensi]
MEQEGSYLQGMPPNMIGMLPDPPVSMPSTNQGFPKKAARNKKTTKNTERFLPIEEALKTELTTNNMKTPISLLQELLSRRGITPQYDLIQVEGTVHEPAFRYRVSYQNKDALGTGKSKKEAKQAAAKALIDKLTGSSFHDFPGAYAHEEVQDANNEEEPTGNPIGWLQEMCMARRWPPPTYETETEKGLPHERQFTIACVVLKHREVGEGKSKKIAKRQAAQKMWQRLQDQPLESNQMMALLDEDGNEELRQTDHGDRYACLKDVSIPTLSKSQSVKVSQFHKALKSRAGKLLQQLQGLSLSDRNVNCTELLDEIAKEQRFLVTYVDIDEKSANNKFQCLVQLSTMPVAVCHGSGLTIPEAHAHAARNSLEYLKIMSKSYTE